MTQVAELSSLASEMGGSILTIFKKSKAIKFPELPFLKFKRRANIFLLKNQKVAENVTKSFNNGRCCHESAFSFLFIYMKIMVVAWLWFNRRHDFFYTLSLSNCLFLRFIPNRRITEIQHNSLDPKLHGHFLFP